MKKLPIPMSALFGTAPTATHRAVPQKAVANPLFAGLAGIKKTPKKAIAKKKKAPKKGC